MKNKWILVFGVWFLVAVGLFAPFTGGSIWTRLLGSPETKLANQKKLQKRLAYNAYFEQFSGTRFQGILDFKKRPQKQGNFVAGSVGQISAIMDSVSGFVWTSPLDRDSGEDVEASWFAAHKKCMELPPKNFWSLPSAGEYLHFLQNGALNELPELNGSVLATFMERKGRFYRPTAFSLSQERAQKRFFQCIGRGSPQTPPNGVFNDDVPAGDLMNLIHPF